MVGAKIILVSSWRSTVWIPVWGYIAVIMHHPIITSSNLLIALMDEVYHIYDTIHLILYGSKGVSTTQQARGCQRMNIRAVWNLMPGLQFLPLSNPHCKIHRAVSVSLPIVLGSELVYAYLVGYSARFGPDILTEVFLWSWPVVYSLMVISWYTEHVLKYENQRVNTQSVSLASC